MPLSKTHKEKTRAAILDAAAVLFRERGFDGVGIDDIMKLMGYDEMRALERRLLTTTTLESKYGD